MLRTPRRRVLVIGGSFSGLAAGRDLANHFLVTIIDAKEPFVETAGWSAGKGGRRRQMKRSCQGRDHGKRFCKAGSCTVSVPAGVFRVHSGRAAGLREAEALGCLDLHAAASDRGVGGWVGVGQAREGRVKGRAKERETHLQIYHSSLVRPLPDPHGLQVHLGRG